MVNCNITDNMDVCTCTYPGCSRKGRCCECILYHRKQGELPGCFFSEQDERTYDRSIAFFVKRHASSS
ncbi:MAG: hypothetical protein GF384_07225 [Elusimicrobia bacterium]|nr:hypothetical protein [Elusimicrobiota bacterium]MBD3412462.1 hypothetical protein [Elusimicrobiota bacterium]